MKRTGFNVFWALFLSGGLMSCHGPNPQPSFKDFLIKSFPKSRDAMSGNVSMTDYDKDGDLDITFFGSVSEEVNWYEYRNDSTWRKHMVGYFKDTETGSASVDIDNDGFMDLVVGRAWFRNPGILDEEPDMPWEMYFYRGGIDGMKCDMTTARLDGDSIRDVVCFSHGKGKLRWFDTESPMNWEHHDMVDSLPPGILPNSIPHSTGDLNGDGLQDITLSSFWFENPGDKDMTWKRHDLPIESENSDARSQNILQWVTDLNDDGNMDIVFALPSAKPPQLRWAENLRRGKLWKVHRLPLPESFRTIATMGVIDINEDKAKDIFLGMQVADSRKKNSNSGNGFFLLNHGKSKRWEVVDAFPQNTYAEWKDTKYGDVDADGDIDMVSLVWNVEQQRYELRFFRNDLIAYNPEE